MKIAITSQHLDPKIVVSGISTVVHNIITYSVNRFFLYEVGYRDGDKKNIKWFFKQIKLLFDFPLFLKRNKVDLVHINIPFDTLGIIRDYTLLRLAKMYKKKVLVHIHGGKLLMIRSTNRVTIKLINKILNESDNVLVLSQTEKKTLKENYNFCHSNYLENAVDTSTIQFNRNSPLAKHRSNQVTFLYLARITESKGIDDVVSALKLLYASVKFNFILCGFGENASKIAAEFKAFMGDDFIFKGVISGDEKLKVMYESDVFLLPSRHSEGLPMSLLETMAAGLVPVVTDEASMKIVVTHGYNGVVVKKRDGYDLFLNLHSLIKDTSLFEKYSLAARKTITENYDIKEYIKKLELIYTSMIAERLSG